MSGLRIIIEGWRITFRVLWKLLTRLLAPFQKLRGEKDGHARREFKEESCFDPPPDIRARPDPYIYSQEWLQRRVIGVVWDNPDFKIFDVVSGTRVSSSDLKPDTDYEIEATIHNNSFMAAISTSVYFEVRGFGVGTQLITSLGTAVVDVPGAGSAIARMRWHTPVTGGHNCLRAIISHIDDVNPLNNIGQHNADIAVPASPTRKIAFLVGNESTTAKHIRLVMDSYHLPEKPMCAESYKQRQSLECLKRLQEANDPRRFPVPTYLNARLSHGELKLSSREEIEVTLELTPPPVGSGKHSVNVHAYEDEVLIGGITAYVLEEGA